MARPVLKLFLMGKTGQGKSATGNTILNRKQYFKTAANTTSETKGVNNGFATFDQYELMVVDGPGLEDTDMDKVQDKETAVKNMNEALLLCHGSVDAFLFVMKFGARFTAEDKDAIETLKKIFGEHFLKHLIVVVTCGDEFENVMEEEKCGFSFEDWCKHQKGEFRQLYADCQGRAVLFYNREKDEGKQQTMIRQVVQLAYNLQSRFGSYTSQCFKMAENNREKMIVEAKAPQLRFEIQRRISLLSAEIEKLPQHPSVEDTRRILQQINELDCEIDKHDKGFGVLQDMKANLRNMRENINDKQKLSDLNKELEKSRRPGFLGILGSILTVVGGFLACVPSLAPVGVSLVETGVGLMNDEGTKKN